MKLTTAKFRVFHDKRQRGRGNPQYFNQVRIQIFSRVIKNKLISTTPLKHEA